uniref:BtsCIR methylase n=1 Tax=Ureibacillus thermosphaericus TaxID=51173 RepID=D2IX37_URETH|nr:BtsCIR methylase [Ureibacillus thermosphaericus]
MKRILYLLTEERPKINIIHQIINLEYKATLHFGAKIVPVMNEENKFTFIYHVKGIEVEGFDAVLIKIVSGHSSFVDYLVFDSNDLKPEKNTITLFDLDQYELDLSYYFGKGWIVRIPSPSDLPKYVVEETKTDDHESRNTNAYQRSSKFVFCELYYGKEVKKYMLYDISDGRTLSGTDTHNFGMRMLVTNNVNLVGVPNMYLPFTDIKEFINEKNRIADNGPSHNVPIRLKLDKEKNVIYISAKLDKGNGKNKNKISNDPNIGAVAIISATLRNLNWKGDIEIINHNLLPSSISSRSNGNKLLYIMKKLGVRFNNINVNWNNIKNNINYFFYNITSEKIVSIYYHLYVEDKLSNARVIFDNHAGCGKSYFRTLNNKIIPVGKEIPLPDLVIFDSDQNIVKVIEAEKAENVYNGVEQLSTFDKFIESYINKYYPGAAVECSVITWGKSSNPYVSFYLDKDGSAVFL